MKRSWKISQVATPAPRKTIGSDSGSRRRAPGRIAASNAATPPAANTYGSTSTCRSFPLAADRGEPPRTLTGQTGRHLRLARGQGRRSVRLLVVFAVPSGLSPLKPPVDHVSLRVPPLAHPVLETRQQDDRDRIRGCRSDRPDHDLRVNGDERGLRRGSAQSRSPLGLRRTRGDAAGEELGTALVDRHAVNMGTVPRPPGRPHCQAAEGRSLSTDGRGMGRIRRSSPRTGKPSTWRRAAASPSVVVWKGQEDVVNIGEPWPSLVQARMCVLGIQKKLHRWSAGASGSPVRRPVQTCGGPAFLTVRGTGSEGTREPARPEWTVRPPLRAE